MNQNDIDLPSDDEIDKHRVAGEITLVLEHGTEADKLSLLTAIDQAAGRLERNRLARMFNLPLA